MIRPRPGDIVRLVGSPPLHAIVQGTYQTGNGTIQRGHLRVIPLASRGRQIRDVRVGDVEAHWRQTSYKRREESDG